MDNAIIFNSTILANRDLAEVAPYYSPRLYTGILADLHVTDNMR